LVDFHESILQQRGIDIGEIDKEMCKYMTRIAPEQRPPDSSCIR
jgi:hypothetical protein